MLQVNVELKHHHYPIKIGQGLLTNPQSYAPLKAGDNVMIVSNPTIAQYYLATVRDTLITIGCKVDTVLLADGEQYKTFESLNQIFTALLENDHHRDTTLVALGGGVIGDVTGYAAASYQRGVRFIQIPTTLLAQIDSSIGGKTAINHPLGKNMIGAFYQPAAVIIDTQVLNTLAKRQVSAGLAEVIKYGVAFDSHFFEWLEQHIDQLMQLDPETLAHCIQRCCQLKAAIVAQDETEQGERALLNFGHTFGHSIEAHLGYGTWLHGESVAVGMLEAAELSKILGNLTEDQLARLEKLLANAVLPTTSPDGMTADQYLPYMWRDKKVLNGQLRLVLLKSFGQAYITTEATEQQILTAIQRFTQH
ncbi:3-dehydroquinate synthase [[Haemophilus] ducreyi]|uniref:3-dehydroquinate synthase n=2 Tax=Haemophilus ducreyi TaxID=730 RepID=AROB_HAEDU|nr:3-dehydroquinate synthase [[Haemophilus] ducreyi]Q7VNR5.1 RecName: Full=3-dehydroquinate synthase; Short=DHQS [[Haemophilus] ducreyi 35000HP]AAP95387.1 3-dehydroquinate synthase [[Haemophilus] ducreyi 35000HP]AKO30506.1 3-dehydroquinate synthase [[Haemophilus] ducreyi]AKO31941.1 3-dehydroquinate synthase [[Haemophilus] ducreyi]AKO33395.1 3-dehydroquinate synthase [[Haemophilus] ducreyi]AKO34843.1 3-dehydroquinate synthase [[Haemophilus] ducreyi]